MNLKTLALLAAGAAAVASCGEGGAVSKNVASSSPHDSEIALLTAEEFVHVVAANDRLAVEASAFLSKSRSDKMKAFAAEMREAHKASSEQLRSAAALLTPSVRVDDTLNADQQRSLDIVSRLSGAIRDSAFRRTQIEAHETILSILTSYAASGDNQKLRDFASKMALIESEHLKSAREMMIMAQ